MRGDATLLARSVGTRLGTRLGTGGTLDPDARARTLVVIGEYVDDVHARDATIDAVATSALRRASDAAAFGRDVEVLAGVAPRIISGDEEAAYSFLGATWGVGAVGRVGVLDVGGGSTELAVGSTARIDRTLSLEIGAVRLAERHPLLLGARSLDRRERTALVTRARAEAASVLAPLAGAADFRQLIAVGGTVFTAAAMIARDPQRDAVPLDRPACAGLIDDLLARDLDARRAMAHIRPQRADILPAGLIVVDEACRLLGCEGVIVSHADLLAGYLRSPAYREHAAPRPAR